MLAIAVRLIKGEKEGGAKDCTVTSLLRERSTSVDEQDCVLVSDILEVTLVEVGSAGKVTEVVEEKVSVEEMGGVSG